MPKERINGLPIDSRALKKVLKPKKIVSLNDSISSSRSVKQKETDLILGDHTTSLLKNSGELHVFENGNGKDDFDGLPLVVRKDRLVQEIENSLAEIEDHYSNTNKLEEEKTAVEMERNTLLKDIEETITEIQNHVLNSSELELEKGALQTECDGLRDQVSHLKIALDGSTGLENGNDMDSRYSALEKETLDLKGKINALTLENEKLKSRTKDSEDGELPSDLMTRELELLHDENSNLQKLLQMAEESEENMAKELKSCQSQLAEMQTINDSLKKDTERLEAEKEQLEFDREDLEEELYSLQKSLKKNGDQNGNNLMLKESKADLAKAQKKCAALEKENSALNKKIDQLEKEIQELQDTKRGKDSASNGAPKTVENVQQLKSALDKLNKETSSLHESLEKAEREIETLKDELKKEREEKEKLKGSASENGKKKKNKKEKEKEKETVNSQDNEEKASEVEAFKKDIYNLKSECEALSETIARTANEKRKLANDIEALNEEKTKLESKVKELEGVVEELTKVKTAKEALEESYSNLRIFHDDLARKLDIANKTNSEKDENLRRTLSEKDTVEKRCAESEATVEKVQKELAASQQDLSSKNDEVKLLKRNFEEQKKEHSTARENERKDKQRLQVEIREMSEKLKGKEEEMNSVLQSHSAKGSELQNLRITVDEMRKELKLTKQNLRGVEEARLVAEKNTQKAEKVMEELEKSNAVYNDMAMEKSLELSRTKRTLEKKVEKLLKENTEMRKKFGLEVPTQSQSPPRLSPVTVQMQKIPSLDVNLEHLSRPSQRLRNDGANRQSRDYSPSSRAVTANGPTSDGRLRRSSIDGDAASDLQNHESDYGRPQRSKELPNAMPPEYRVVASEVASAPPKREFAGSVVHVASTVRDHSPASTRRDSGLNHWRGDERIRDERKLEEHRPEDRQRPTDNTGMQENSEATFQVVGYRKPGGKVIHEHWV